MRPSWICTFDFGLSFRQSAINLNLCCLDLFFDLTGIFGWIGGCRGLKTKGSADCEQRKMTVHEESQGSGWLINIRPKHTHELGERKTISQPVLQQHDF